MRKSNLSLVFAAMFVLAGCGEVAERQCTHQLTIHGQRPHRPLTVTIRPVPDVASNPEQHVVTDSHGEATARFESSWYAAYLTRPPIGAVPRHSDKPEYVVLSGNRRFVISPKTPDVQYRWQDGGWWTDASLQP